MIEFFTENASAIFAIIGALAGSLLTGVISYFSMTKEAKLRVVEKIIDKKLDAHEQLINVIGQIRTMVLLGGSDGERELRRCPAIMMGQAEMSTFLETFSEMRNKSERWLSFEVKREISLFLDYLVNIKDMSKDSTDEAMQETGAILRYDFIELSLKLENAAHDFFNHDLVKLNHKTDRKWHKYPVEETMKKLEDTELFKKRETIHHILQRT